MNRWRWGVNKPRRKRRILIVGEGRETEYNYFVGLRTMFEAELEATATSVSVRRGKGGDARQIVNTAIAEAKKFDPDRKAGDLVFLLLDTEGAGRAPELPAAERLAQKNKIEIVYSSPAFEYWLLCHFLHVPRRHFEDCDAVIVELEKKWKNVRKNGYDKADPDVFDRVAQRLATACSEALLLDLHHIKTTGTAPKTNPSTQVYELVARLIGVKTDDRCPIQGVWRLVADPSVFVPLQKGDPIPDHEGSPAHWQL